MSWLAVGSSVRCWANMRRGMMRRDMDAASVLSSRNWSTIRHRYGSMWCRVLRMTTIWLSIGIRRHVL
jgi:hypothetical protein